MNIESCLITAHLSYTSEDPIVPQGGLHQEEVSTGRLSENEPGCT